MAQKNSSKEIVMSCVDAINRGDFKAARQYVSDDMSFVGVLGSRRGADAYFKDMERLQLKYDVKKVFVDEQDVCLLYDLNMSGVNTFAVAGIRFRTRRYDLSESYLTHVPFLKPAGNSYAVGMIDLSRVSAVLVFLMVTLR